MADKEIVRPGPQSNFPDITFPGFRFFQDVAKWINNAIARLVVLETVQAWQVPTLLNGWVNSGDPYPLAGYYKDPLGIVRLQGLINSGTLGAAAFTLPAGYRPGAYIHVMGGFSYDGANYQMAGVRIYADGSVIPGGPGGNTWFSIDNISFRAA